MSAVPRCAALVLLVSSACVEPPPVDTTTNLIPDPLPQAVYLIGEDDTLAAIAHRFAVPGGWRALAAANHLLDPDHIEAGAGLVIPTAGLEAFGHDPFSLYDEYELVPRRPPIELPPEPTSPSVSDDVDWLPGSDTNDACGGRHHHLPMSPEAMSAEDAPWCAWLADATVCVEDDGGNADDEVVVTVDGQAWLRLPWSYIAPLELVEVDLDGDGSDEMILADLEGVSNGAGITWYAMVVADRAGGPAHRYTTNGWRLDRLADGGCALLHQTFEGIDDPLAGYGNYDVVRELVWQDGALATRGPGIRADRWSDQPHQLRAEPRLEPQVLSRRVGTVVDFDGRPERRQALTLAFGGERVTLRAPSGGWSDDEADAPEATYVGLGWAGADVLLPDDYRPPPAALLGRTATVETRLRLPEGTLSQVVWLDPAPR